MHEIIIEKIKKLLEKASLPITDVKVSLDEDLGITKISLSCEDTRLLIGRNGDVLQAVNHLVHRLAEKDEAFQGFNEANFLIDVDGYHERRLEELKTKARIVADRARSFKSDIALESMSAYDRLIVHSFVSNLPDISTESQGEGKDRHIIIKFQQ